MSIPSIYIMPFGKYKGLPIDSVNPSYLLWLYDEPWVKLKYPDIHEYVKEHYQELYDLEGDIYEGY